MCGIAGAIHRDGGVVDVAWLANGAEIMRERGPDDHGYLAWTRQSGVSTAVTAESCKGAQVAFCHRRLAILDLSKAGSQPMRSNCGLYNIVFNGEIYNFVELRRELQKLGTSFRSNCDTEVLLHAYKEWGEDCLLRLEGMFAFAVLDLKRDAVFLARDHFGIKPLYVCQTAGAVAFASDPKVLLSFRGVKRGVDPDRLFQYLRFGMTDTGGDTLWRDISQIPPAHSMTIPLDCRREVRPNRYWSVSCERNDDITFGESAACLRQLFVDSVTRQLRSDVPVGACLSGGIDSSAIVLTARGALGRQAALHTFSYIDARDEFCETEWVDIAVEAADTVSHTVSANGKDLVGSLRSLIWTQGEPFASTSIFAQYCVFEAAAAAGIRVMLDGQGADELFGGYWNSIAARLATLIGRGSFARANHLLGASRADKDTNWWRLVAATAGMLLPSKARSLARRAISRDLMPSWLDQEWFSKRGALAGDVEYGRGPEYLRSSLAASLESGSLPMLLRYEDRNSMRVSIESRVPFLTPRIASFAASLPEEFLVDSEGLRKAILRAAMSTIVPETILKRRDKIGFGTAEGDWLRSVAPWVEERLRSDAAQRIPVLRRAGVTREWSSIRDGRRASAAHAWRWINLIEWADQFDVTFEG